LLDDEAFVHKHNPPVFRLEDGGRFDTDGSKLMLA
jgi:hypothetical protein